jgi:ABC-2 type transport system ATP-binding protein
VDAPAIELRAVGKQYGTTVALRGVSLTVGRGEVFGYVGANGAGKTTTIKILTGLLHPTTGDAAVCGLSVRDRPLEVKARLGYVPESGAVFEKLSTRELLAAAGRLYRLPEATIAERSEHWLATFDLTARADQQIGTLSKGTKQKVCWMVALLHEPEVLVLDEPLNGLDVETVARVKDLLRSLAAQGRTVFYSSHMIDVVEKVCTRVAVLHRGEVQVVGTPEEVRALAHAGSLEQALLALWQDGGVEAGSAVAPVVAELTAPLPDVPAAP